MNVPAKPTKLETFKAAMLTPEQTHQLYSSLPSHIRPETFERNWMNALMANPSLLDHDPRLVYREVAKAAGLGLLLDPILGEAYIVVAYNYKTKQQEPQLRVGYKGMIKLARQSGDIAAVYAHEVHQFDHIEADLGFPKRFSHRPKLFTDRGPIVGYAAVVGYRDGTFDFEPMSLEDCLKIRDRSDGWKAFKDGKIKSTPWSTDESEMSKKTALRRLMKRQNQSPELQRAFQIEDQADHEGLTRSAPISIPSAPPAPQIEHRPEQGEQPEVNQQAQGVTNAKTTQKADTAPKPRASRAKPQADPISTGKGPKPAPDIENEYDQWLTWATEQMIGATDADVLMTFFNSFVEQARDTLFDTDFEDLLSTYQSCERKLTTE